MTVRLARHDYGKSKVRLTYLNKRSHVRDLVQLVAQVLLAGDFDAAYTSGDNARVIPTDTMKNMVYAIAKLHGVQSIEAFAQRLAKHFLDRFSHVREVDVRIQQDLWSRFHLDGSPSQHAFMGRGEEQNTCSVTLNRDGISLTSGLSGLRLLKTAGSGFSGFLKDEFTLLRETDDRILETTISATWSCRDLDHDWTSTRRTVRDLMLRVFAERYSPSVQRTLYEMGELVILSCPEMDEISITMPNQHHLLVDLAAIELENDDEIFVPTSEPFGVISATLQRTKDQ